MRTRTTKILGTIAVTAGLIGGAYLAPAVFAQTRAGTVATTPAQWLTIPQLYGKLDAAGYTAIDAIEREKDRYEVKATDRDGRRVELEVHPITGEVIKTKVKRDQRSDDRRSESSVFAPKALS